MSVLSEIIAVKREHIAAQQARISYQSLDDACKAAPSPRGFADAITRRLAASEIALIAELKKASPSKGVIRDDFDVSLLAEAYQQGGATCLSVLTDTPYFQGDDRYIAQAQTACNLPVLRKDFMIEPYQIAESRALGADCILLIMAALSNAQARELEDAACHYGMDVLVESHNAEEVERALTHLRSPLMGINNRDLNTLDVSLEHGIALLGRIPDDRVAISESGIYTYDDIQRMRAHGAHCFLVGESLMKQENVQHATSALLGM